MRQKSDFSGLLIRVALFLGILAPLAFPQRIVSLAPGLTEIVCALKREANLVGVTRFCDFPATVTNVPRVGGLLDLDFEKLVVQRPDLVILYAESLPRLETLRERSRLLVVPHATLADLYVAIRRIAAALHAKPRGEELCLKIESHLARISAAVRSRPSSKTMLIAGRESIRLRNMYLIGRHDFINDLLTVCGGENAYRGEIPYPVVSLESVLAMDPACIVELSAFYEGLPENLVRRSWSSFPGLQAVRKERIFFVKENYWLRPGPRVTLIADGLLRILHPDIACK